MSRILTFAAILFIIISCTEEPNKPVSVEFRIAEEEPADSLIELSIKDRETFYVHPSVLLDNKMIIKTEVVDWFNEKAVGVLFNEEGTEKLSEITRENIGKRMAILVDGVLVTAPIIRAEISGGEAIINGGFNEEEAEKLADSIVKNLE